MCLCESIPSRSLHKNRTHKHKLLNFTRPRVIRLLACVCVLWAFAYYVDRFYSQSRLSYSISSDPRWRPGSLAPSIALNQTNSNNYYSPPPTLADTAAAAAVQPRRTACEGTHYLKCARRLLCGRVDNAFVDGTLFEMPQPHKHSKPHNVHDQCRCVVHAL